jgi:hypothetical protein
MDDALRFAPFLFDVEVIPYLPVAPFDEVEAIRVGMNYQFDCELPQNAAAVTTDEMKQRSLSLQQPRAGAILGRQVEEQMAVNDVGVGFALSAPHACQTTRDAASKEPLVESLTDFGEELAVGIVKRDRA